MSTVSRILHGAFTKSVQAKIRTKVGAVSYSIAKPSSTHDDESHLQSLVDNFKSSCDNYRFRCDRGVYKQHVTQLAAAKQYSMIEDILQHQKKYNNIRNEGFAIRIIALYGLAGMIDHARKLFDELPLLNCPRTVKSFNTLLNACLASGKPEKAFELFEELPRNASIQPDLISYSTLIHAHCIMGSIDGVLSRFQELESPNVIVFNTILGALYVDLARFSDGESMWEMMKSKNVTPNVRSYNLRLRRMFYDNRVSEAIELVGEMERINGVKPDSYTYNALIDGFCAKRNVDEAKKWYDVLKKSKLRPKLLSSYVKLISASHEAGNLDVALEVCLDAISSKLVLESAVVTPVIEGLTKKRMTEDASKLEKLVNSNK